MTTLDHRLRRWVSTAAVLATTLGALPACAQSTSGLVQITAGAGATFFYQHNDRGGFVFGDTRVNDRRRVSLRGGAVEMAVRIKPTMLVHAMFAATKASIGQCEILEAQFEACQYNDPAEGVSGGLALGGAWPGSRASFGLMVTPSSERRRRGSNAPPAPLKHGVTPMMRASIGSLAKVQLDLTFRSIVLPGQVPMSTVGLGLGHQGVTPVFAAVRLGRATYQDGAGIVAASLGATIRSRVAVIVGGTRGGLELNNFSVGVHAGLF